MVDKPKSKSSTLTFTFTKTQRKPTMPKPIYTPPPTLLTHTDHFRHYINKRYSLSLNSYADLHTFSVTRLNDFWLSVWHYCGIIGTLGRKAIDDDASITSRPKFFPGTKLNYAQNLLRGNDDAIAVIEMDESNQISPRKYTWKELRMLTARYAGVLRREGVRKGDVVVLVGGNCARSLALLCAAGSIGAIFASFATDIGEKALRDRVCQLKPRVAIAEVEYVYNGKVNEIAQKVLAAIQGVATGLLVARGTVPREGRRLEDLVRDEEDVVFEQVEFSTPFVVMFSSGTTGVPKGIVHSHGGLVLNGAKEHKIHNNFGQDDVHFHYSGIGWTLWNISLGAMFCETTMVLYDGSPFYPDSDSFLRNVFATGVTGYGGSPRFFSELQKANVKPRRYATQMHTLLSTGALLTPGTASWLAEAFGPACQIGFSGGTELCGNFMTGTRSLACYPGEIAVKELGMDVEAWGPDGKSVPDGEAGELVCKKPFPNMPVMLWNDPKGERYDRSYFSGFKGVWTHGDLMRINPETQGIYVLGRSDGVLNPSGVRFGTSELYNILSAPRFHGRVHDGLAIGQQRTTGKYSDPSERVVFFLKLAEHDGKTLQPDKRLVEEIRQEITRDLSRRHIPHFFFAVDEIPHNANGKKMEIQVKQVCNGGREALAKMTLAQPEREMLERFVKFHDIEEVSKSAEDVRARL